MPSTQIKNIIAPMSFNEFKGLFIKVHTSAQEIEIHKGNGNIKLLDYKYDTKNTKGIVEVEIPWGNYKIIDLQNTLENKDNREKYIDYLEKMFRLNKIYRGRNARWLLLIEEE